MQQRRGDALKVATGARVRVLITGSTGLIGHAVAARLREEHEVLGFDLRPGPLTNVIGDISDTRLMDSLVAQSDSIVHLAALLTPHISTHSEAAFFETNVRGTE